MDLSPPGSSINSTAAHLNHRLRGAEADQDEKFCANLCERLGLPLHARRADPRPLARQRGLGLEEAGRRLRRQFLNELLRSHPTLVCAAGVAVVSAVVRAPAMEAS